MIDSTLHNSIETNMEDRIPLPIVTFALGDSMDDLLRRSTFPFASVKEIRAIDLIALTQAVALRLARRHGGFTLPMVGFASISLIGNRVVEVRSSMLEGAVCQTDALNACREVEQILSRAGWSRVMGVGNELENLARKLDSTETPLETTAVFGAWRLGDDVMAVEVDRSVPTVLGGQNGRTICVVRARAENGRIYREASATVSGSGRDIVWRRQGP